jgi:hypothetical protein
MSASEQAWLFDPAADCLVEAELWDEIRQSDLDDWEQHWKPARAAAVAQLKADAVPKHLLPVHTHWDWQKKFTLLGGLLMTATYSVTANGLTQGLAMANLTASAIEPSQAGRSMVYLSYLEAAPWNQPELVGQPRLLGSGTTLLTAVVERSIKDGMSGRLGLHSLPRSEAFYRKHGFIDLGADGKCHGLRYFELTAERATDFLAKGDS